MKRSSFVIFAGFAWSGAAAWAADATRPIDYTERNAIFAPRNGQPPADKRSPAAELLPPRRVEPAKVEKPAAAVGERRAAIDPTETREKALIEKNTRTPEKVDTPKSGYDQQRARISTAADTNRPPIVARYQDGLTAATASNMARFPAVGGTVKAKINRFVFRKNGGELPAGPGRAPVVPAAGGAAPTR
jgi:hypothetical protein